METILVEVGREGDFECIIHWSLDELVVASLCGCDAGVRVWSVHRPSVDDDIHECVGCGATWRAGEARF